MSSGEKLDTTLIAEQSRKVENMASTKSKRLKLEDLDNTNGALENKSHANGNGNGHEHNSSEIEEDIWLTLPDEIWSFILSWTANEEKTNTRIVCKSLKDIVDLHSSYSIKIREDMDVARRDFRCRLRAHCVEVASLQNPDLNLCFKFPSCVKELVVTTHVMPEKFISLCESFREIQVLRFIATIMSMKTFTEEMRSESVKALASLRKLREIEIIIYNFGMRQPWSCETFNTVFCSDIELLPFSALTSVSINIALHHSEMSKFFEFLVARCDTIRHVTTRISCIRQPPPRFQDDKDKNNVLDSSYLAGLKKLNLFSLHVYGAPVCELCELPQIWNAVLLSQTTLRNLTMDHHDLRVPDVMKIITNNSELRTCKLYRVSWTSVRELEEMVMVDTCLHLEELLLDFMHTFVILCAGKDTAERCTIKFFELDNLPHSLRKLSLKGYQFPRNQILSALSRMKYVEEVNLHDCIFRDEPNKLSLLQHIFIILASMECGIRRFIFSAPMDLESEGSMWKKMMDEARSCGVLRVENMHRESQCIIPYIGESEYYDFSFTKDALKEFVNRCAVVLDVA